MNIVLAIALGGALGAVCRHYVNAYISGVFGSIVGNVGGGHFPAGIMVCNILGSFLMGLMIAGFAAAWDVPQSMRALLTVGFLGAFTTFSTFSMDIVLLAERGAYLTAFTYMSLSVVLGVGALLLGMSLIKLFPL